MRKPVMGSVLDGMEMKLVTVANVTITSGLSVVRPLKIGLKSDEVIEVLGYGIEQVNNGGVGARLSWQLFQKDLEEADNVTVLSEFSATPPSTMDTDLLLAGTREVSSVEDAFINDVRFLPYPIYIPRSPTFVLRATNTHAARTRFILYYRKVKASQGDIVGLLKRWTGRGAQQSLNPPQLVEGL